MLCNSYSNCFADFYIFPILGIGAINFSKQKNSQPTLVLGCYFSLKQVEKLFNFVFRKLHNVIDVFVQNCYFYRGSFSIQGFLK